MRWPGEPEGAGGRGGPRPQPVDGERLPAQGELTPEKGQGPPEVSGVDLARVALRAAKERARERGALVRQRREARRGGLRSGARAGGRDPLPLGAAVARLSVERGWEMPLAVGGVLGRWPELVGPEVAQHCAPESYDEESRVLTVRCDATAWATQLRLLAPQLLARLNADLGQGTVKLIKVMGPAAPNRPSGRLRAPGSRGPGDTYG